AAGGVGDGGLELAPTRGQHALGRDAHAGQLVDHRDGPVGGEVTVGRVHAGGAAADLLAVGVALDDDLIAGGGAAVEDLGEGVERGGRVGLDDGRAAVEGEVAGEPQHAAGGVVLDHVRVLPGECRQGAVGL